MNCRALNGVAIGGMRVVLVLRRRLAMVSMEPDFRLDFAFIYLRYLYLRAFFSNNSALVGGKPQWMKAKSPVCT